MLPHQASPKLLTTTAVSGGNVTNNGGAEVTAWGIYWGTAQNEPQPEIKQVMEKVMVYSLVTSLACLQIKNIMYVLMQQIVKEQIMV